MFVNVVDLDAATPTRSEEIEVPGDFEGAGSALWVPVPSSLDANILDNVLADEAPGRSLRSDVTVVGLHPNAAERLGWEKAVFDDIHVEWRAPRFT